ncbi:MAG TPA: TadE family protein [Microbacteriaceae bacterium]|nr:TadE family protein [Microbacteriaceae bacterium]
MRLNNEDGGVTAEFAVTLPVILMVLAVILGALTLATHRISLTSAVYDIARLEARGDVALAQTRMAQLSVETRISQSITDGVLCVTGEQSPGKGILKIIVISATGCAATSAALRGE